MNDVLQELLKASEEAVKRATAATNAAEVEQIRIDYLGRNGLFPVSLRSSAGTVPIRRERAGKRPLRPK